MVNSAVQFIDSTTKALTEENFMRIKTSQRTITIVSNPRSLKTSWLMVRVRRRYHTWKSSQCHQKKSVRAHVRLIIAMGHVVISKDINSLQDPKESVIVRIRADHILSEARSPKSQAEVSIEWGKTTSVAIDTSIGREVVIIVQESQSVARDSSRI